MTILSSLLQSAVITMMISGLGGNADPLIGAWGGQGSRGGQATEVVVIFTAAHQVAVWFDPISGDVVHTNGGLWNRSGTRVTEIVEFDSDSPERAGSSVSFDIELSDTELSIVGSEMRLTRLDPPEEHELEGAWRLVERMETGVWVAAEAPSMTVRLMSARRFQQIVYDPESGRLVSTFGGTYVIDASDVVETVEYRRAAAEAAGDQIRYAVGREADGWRQTSGGIGQGWRERTRPRP